MAKGLVTLTYLSEHFGVSYQKMREIIEALDIKKVKGSDYYSHKAIGIIEESGLEMHKVSLSREIINYKKEIRKRDLIIEKKDKEIKRQQSYLDNINRICTEVGGTLITVASESAKQELEVI